MSDFNGMGGALVVCLISQSIVFMALGLMAGVIRSVGVAVGGKPPVAPGESAQVNSEAIVLVAEEDDEMEVVTVIMAALSAEHGRTDKIVFSGVERPSAWRLVSLQEATRLGGRI